MSEKMEKEQSISALAERIKRLARNLWWTWNHQAQSIFEELSPTVWQHSGHNPIAVLNELSEQELKARLYEQGFRKRVERLLEQFESYVGCEKTWGSIHAPQFRQRPVAYFCAEIGLHESLPISAGGLGVLAGDHLRSASDLGIGLVAVSLFYREGYFMQAINGDGWQRDYYKPLNPELLPLEPVTGKDGRPLLISVQVSLSDVKARVWKIAVGRCDLYLLDTFLEENEPQFRALTSRLYTADHMIRIFQELILGIGGVRLLRQLKIEPSVYHLNEGHSAFLILELIREKLQEGLTFSEALERVKQQCVFTTHTPVEAGHDYFDKSLFKYALSRYESVYKVPIDEIYKLGQVYPGDPQQPFCTTVFAIRGSRHTNAVSELHGQVTRSMWQKLFPSAATPEAVPIRSITNGVHVATWIHPLTTEMLQNRFLIHGNMAWDELVNTHQFWESLADPQQISDEELWALKYRLRRRLIERIREMLAAQHGKWDVQTQFTISRVLDPNVLTIGFARRFALYKRPTLIFRNLDRLVSLALDPKRPVQFIFAGKAHPNDEPAKRVLQEVVQLSWHSPLRGRLVFLENYDIGMARELVAGCDVWLNNPRRPLEACGTSGMKAALNATLNLSVLDGWWREAYNGKNGFAIGEDKSLPHVEEQDSRDAESLYRVLAEEVVPAFYDRDEKGIPRKWLQMIRAAFATIPPRFNTHRMLKEYLEMCYQQTPH